MQTATRWAKNAAIVYLVFYAFTLVVGTLVWAFDYLRVCNKPSKRRKVGKLWDFYTSPDMGLAYLCYGVGVVLLLCVVLYICALVGGDDFVIWWSHLWGY